LRNSLPEAIVQLRSDPVDVTLNNISGVNPVVRQRCIGWPAMGSVRCGASYSSRQGNRCTATGPLRGSRRSKRAMWPVPKGRRRGPDHRWYYCAGHQERRPEVANNARSGAPRRVVAGRARTQSRPSRSRPHWFVRCLPHGCYAEVVIDDAMICISVGLKGFGEGYDKLR
jgi:hypothetical protein